MQWGLTYSADSNTKIMGIEKWIAAASIGLFAMFVAEMVSIYSYMQQAPEDMEFGIIFEPDPKILQFISIGAAPASIMAAVSFILSKRYGSRQIGFMIMTGGSILLAGMAYCSTYQEGIHSVYLTTATEIAPPLFMIVAVPVIIFGAILLRTKPHKPKRDYV